MTPTLWHSNTPGVYLGLSESDYHSNREAISSSLLRWSHTLAHLEWQLAHPEEEDDNAALIVGSSIHQAVLTPSLPLEGIVRRPDGLDMRTKEGKAWAAGQTGRILTGAEYDAIAGCRASLVNHPFVRRNVLHPGTLTEVSLLVQRDGYQAKARIDIVPPKVGWLCDLKSTREGEASLEGFRRTMAQRRYHAQAAWYLDLWNETHPDDKREDFVFVVVEKTPPFAVGVYQVHPTALEAGRQLNAERLSVFLECRRSGVWPGYSTEPVVAELPPWSK